MSAGCHEGLQACSGSLLKVAPGMISSQRVFQAERPTKSVIQGNAAASSGVQIFMIETGGQEAGEALTRASAAQGIGRGFQDGSFRLPERGERHGDDRIQ